MSNLSLPDEPASDNLLLFTDYFGAFIRLLIEFDNNVDFDAVLTETRNGHDNDPAAINGGEIIEGAIPHIRALLAFLQSKVQ